MAHQNTLIKLCEIGDLRGLAKMINQYKTTTEDIRADDNKVLKRAFATEQFEVVEYLFERFKLTADDVRINNNEILRKACIDGSMELIQYLAEKIKLTVEDVIRYETDDAMSAFCEACMSGNFEIVQYLADHFEMTVEHARADNCGALTVSCMEGSLEIVQYLTDRFGLTAEDVRKSKAICQSPEYPEIIQFLVEHFDLNIDDIRNNTMLISACESGNFGIVQYLADRFGITSADVIASAVIYESTLAACEGDPAAARHKNRIMKGFYITCSKDCPEELISFVKFFDIKHISNNKALFLTCETGSLESAQFLAEYFEITAEDAREKDCVAFRRACVQGHIKCVKWFVDHFGITAEDVRDCDNWILYMVCKFGFLNIAQFLIDRFDLTKEDAKCVEPKQFERLKWGGGARH